MIDAIRIIHQSIDDGVVLAEWPDFLPQKYRGKVKAKYGLKDRFFTYKESVSKLSSAERLDVLLMLNEQNSIDTLLPAVTNCGKITDLPVSIQEPIKKLFEFAFGLLTDFGIRDRQYRLIHKKIDSKVCPFCGFEYFSAPTSKREALDHYLAESKYPFAAANLRNLVPMGGKCNSQYKRSEDVMWRADGTRRMVFDPYLAGQQILSLDNSKINNTLVGPLVAEWVIDFSDLSEEVSTWDEVFSLRKRYRDDVLNEETIKQWMGEFRSWCLRSKQVLTDHHSVASAIEAYGGFLGDCGFNDRAFIKAAVFRFFLNRFRTGCQRVRGVMCGLAGVPAN
ncbi:hypothetical protein [Pseudoduganella namucuonensis]|uniref:hypothetical protein n=1 Tax=Pseudoduganella namucuonensis TaxID=1035707 RepID=UPI0011606476|nr:hypothetical protein [Pseudoduganella namucuonensis]